MKSEHLLAYLAGIVDGEGTIGLYSNGVGKQRRLILEVKMTHKPIIDLLHETFGGSLIERRSKNPRWKDQWRWRVVSAEARAVYRQLEPFLILKRIDLENKDASDTACRAVRDRCQP